MLISRNFLAYFLQIPYKVCIFAGDKNKQSMSGARYLPHPTTFHRKDSDFPALRNTFV